MCADVEFIAGSPTQKGIASYALSSNRQRPLAGAARNAVFNTARRVGGQILYVLPPFVIAYAAMEWAIERFVIPRILKRRTC